MAKQDYLVSHQDRGCLDLTALLNREIRCLECPLETCLYDLSGEEAEKEKKRLRLLLTEHA